MTQHTPGPWWVIEPKKVDGKHYAAGDAFKIGAQDVVVARDRSGWPITSVSAHSPDAEPNARLIAAAPDLLALARAMMQAIETCGDQPIMAWRGAIALHIAKATSQGSPDTIEPSNAEGMVP